MIGKVSMEPKRHVHFSRRDFLKFGGVISMGMALSSCNLFPIFSSPTSTPIINPLETEVVNTHLDTLILEEMKRQHLAGVAACLIRDQVIVWSGGYGWANIEQSIPMTSNIVLNIASTSKVITATALMQLWEKNLFGLDDDINAYTPFPIRNPNHPSKRITFRHLLTHQSSIRDGAAYSASYACGDPTTDLSIWLSQVLQPGGRFYSPTESFWQFEPGEQWSYSNIGFGLIGYLVELLAQTPFAEYCREHIFDPLKMDHTGFYLSDLHGIVHAVPYEFEGTANSALQMEKQPNADKEFVPLCLYSFPNIPDGLVRTNVQDLARFLISVQNPSIDRHQYVIQPKTKELMLSTQVTEPYGIGTLQGLGWIGQRSDAQMSWGHTGGDPGVSSSMWLTDHKGGIIVLANSGGNLSGIVSQISVMASRLG